MATANVLTNSFPRAIHVHALVWWRRSRFAVGQPEANIFTRLNRVIAVDRSVLTGGVVEEDERRHLSAPLQCKMLIQLALA